MLRRGGAYASGAIASGAHASAVPGRSRSRESTPITWYGCPSSRTVVPTTAGSLPNRLRQSAGPRTISRSRPGCCSSAANQRPCAIGTPRVGSSEAVPSPMGTRTDSVASIRFTPLQVHAPILGTAFRPEKSSRYWIGESDGETPRVPQVFSKITIRSGSRNRSGARSTPRTTLKTAVAAPMPTVSVRTTERAKPGARSRGRKPIFNSWRTSRIGANRARSLPSAARRGRRRRAVGFGIPHSGRERCAGEGYDAVRLERFQRPGYRGARTGGYRTHESSDLDRRRLRRPVVLLCRCKRQGRGETGQGASGHHLRGGREVGAGANGASGRRADRGAARRPVQEEPFRAPAQDARRLSHPCPLAHAGRGADRPQRHLHAGDGRQGDRRARPRCGLVSFPARQDASLRHREGRRGAGAARDGALRHPLHQSGRRPEQDGRGCEVESLTAPPRTGGAAAALPPWRLRWLESSASALGARLPAGVPPPPGACPTRRPRGAPSRAPRRGARTPLPARRALRHGRPNCAPRPAPAGQVAPRASAPRAGRLRSPP